MVCQLEGITLGKRKLFLGVPQEGRERGVRGKTPLAAWSWGGGGDTAAVGGSYPPVPRRPPCWVLACGLPPGWGVGGCGTRQSG